MLYGLVVALHVLVSIILILVVLLQTGKGADLAGAFGGGGSQTAFGSRGAATFLSKMTTSAAVVFMVTSFSLAVLSARGSSSILEETGVPASGAPAPPPLSTGVPPEEATEDVALPDGSADGSSTESQDSSGVQPGTGDEDTAAPADGEQPDPE